MKADLLKGLLRENGDTYEDYAKVIGKTVTTVQTRLKENSFTWEELEKTRIHYQLSNERFMQIFFGN